MPNNRDPGTAWGRLLDKLFAGRRQVPFVHQAGKTDCGVACLAMSLAYHGKWVEPRELRKVFGEGRDGSSARALLSAARSHGLRGRAVRIDEVTRLAEVPAGTVLHWSFSHFVVFERRHKKEYVVLDPARGRVRLPEKEVSNRFTGVALLFEPDDHFETGGVRSYGFGRFMRPLFSHWRILYKVILASVMLQLLGLALPVATGVVVDQVVPAANENLLLIMLLAAGALFLYRFFVKLLRENLLLKLRAILDAKLTLGFLEHMVSLPYAFYERRGHGDLAVRLESNAILREILSTTVLSAILDGGLILIYLLILFFGDWRLGLIAGGFAAVRVGIYLAARKVTRERATAVIQGQSQTRGFQMQLLHGMETLKTTGNEERATGQFANVYNEELNATIAQARLNALLGSLLDAISVSGPLLFLLCGAWLVMEGILSLGMLLGLAAVAAGFWTPLDSLVQAALQVQRAKSYLERIDDVITSEPEQNRDEVQPPPTLSGAIAIENVSFSYGKDSPRVLHELSIDIEPGEVIGIAGRSGSGKSTLASLLCGLYRSDSGRILFDRHDIHTLDLRLMRKQLGVVIQKPYLFGTSIKNNITLNDPDVPMDRVIRVARLAAIHADIEALPLGYDTPLSDLGGSLSGGQCQRIAIARALLRDPALLILDEATSALDVITEQEIYENLKMVRATQIIIAHRLSTIRDADRIIVLDEGRVVEQGGHDDLINAGGMYATLVSAQMRQRTTPVPGIG